MHKRKNGLLRRFAPRKDDVGRYCDKTKNPPSSLRGAKRRSNPF